LVWYRSENLIDTLATDVPISSGTYQIQNQAGAVVHSGTITVGTPRAVGPVSDVPRRLTAQLPVGTSYHTDVALGVFELPESSEPYLVFFNLQMQGGGSEQIAHQLFWTNNRIINMTILLGNYLDKARLREADPTLQWSTNEKVEAIYQGLHHVNGEGAETTYWRPSDFPQSLSQYWKYASALWLLNTRYIAEGMTKFNFTGLNTTLDVDRTEALTYKMEELKGFLDKLSVTKASAIRAVGPGTPDSTVGATVGRSRIGMLGLTINPTNNIVDPFAGHARRINRFRRFV